MILIFALSILQLSFAAVPFRKVHNPSIIEQLEGFLYDVPEYEDDQFLDYEISRKAGTPVLSLLQMPKFIPNAKDDNTSKEKLEYITVELDGVLARLQAVRGKLFDGNKALLHEDLSKSLESLKKLEYTLRPKTPQYVSSIQQLPFFPKMGLPSDVMGLLSKLTDPLSKMEPNNMKSSGYRSAIKIMKLPFAAAIPIKSPPLHVESIFAADKSQETAEDVGTRDNIATEVETYSTSKSVADDVEAQINVNEEETATGTPLSDQETKVDKNKKVEDKASYKGKWAHDSSNSL